MCVRAMGTCHFFPMLVFFFRTLIFFGGVAGSLRAFTGLLTLSEFYSQFSSLCLSYFVALRSIQVAFFSFFCMCFFLYSVFFCTLFFCTLFFLHFFLKADLCVLGVQEVLLSCSSFPLRCSPVPVSPRCSPVPVSPSECA